MNKLYFYLLNVCDFIICPLNYTSKIFCEKKLMSEFSAHTLGNFAVHTSTKCSFPYGDYVPIIIFYIIYICTNTKNNKKILHHYICTNINIPRCHLDFVFYLKNS